MLLVVYVQHVTNGHQLARELTNEGVLPERNLNGHTLASLLRERERESEKDLLENGWEEVTDLKLPVRAS